MTDHHPVTKEELDMIKNDCAYPEKPYCEGCKYDGTNDEDLPCKFKGANALMDEVLSRPDPLAQLQAEYERGFSDGQKGIKHIKTY